MQKGEFSVFFSAFSTTFNFSMKILSRFFDGKYKKATLNSRTLTENHPDRGLVTNTYDKSSNLISMNRASIGAISFRYSYNRLLSRTMPGSSGNDLYDVVYTYGTPGDGKNGAGRIVAIDQGQGFKVDHYSYDELGQRVVEQSTIQVPQVGQRTYQTEFKYSSFGRILQASYPDGDVVNYHYTDKGELFSIESTAPGEPKLFVVQETQYNGFGQIGTLIYGNGTKTTYNYASSDFVTSGLGHLNKTALFTSTVEGKATLGGATTSLASRDYQYSNLGMVSSLNKSIHSSLAAGITSLDYSFSYDDKGRLQGSTLATGGMNIYELTMGYNAVGGITSKDSDLPNGGHPLVNPNLKYDLSYSYNPAKPHQLLSVTEVGPNGGITNFSYDDVGNLTESFGPSGTEELIWNELQQLSGVMNGNGIHHYVYDHNGERIMKSSINRSWVQVNDQNVDDIQYLEPYTLYVNSYYVVTSFHNGDHISKHYYMNTQRVATDISINYQGPPPPIAPGAPMSSDSAQSTGMGISASFEDDLNKILQQFDAGDLSSSLSENGVTIEKYYPNAASESESINRILYWYHPDYLGSVDLVTDRNGVAYEFFLYTPWGEDMYSYNAGTSSFTSPYRFNGKEKDPETGYSYYGARYYQSKFSIWMSVDPLAHETLEPFVYTGNNPVMLVDPDGRKIVLWWENHSFLGFKWTSYVNGWSKSSGSVFSATFASTYSFNTVFQNVVRQLERSETSYTVNLVHAPSSYIAKKLAQERRKGEGGNYSPSNHSINFLTQELSSWPEAPYSSRSAVFEEFFHAGQYDYYGESIGERTHLEIEVEAKFAKAYSGLSAGIGYEENFMTTNGNILQRLRDLNGDVSQLSEDDMYSLDIAIFNFARNVADNYGYSIEDYQLSVPDLLEYFQATANGTN